jgi:hypothetical protein
MSEANEDLTDAEWQRVAEAMAEADERPRSDFADYLSRAKIISAAVETLFEIIKHRSGN